jgi:UDP-GlcNAc:undecaprenyl-phosphate GlcNAc-1-phosphate transferase
MSFLIVALMGGVGGFLYFNLRYPGNRRARVFSATTAACCWASSLPGCSLPVAGERAAMTPVTALWLFALPLMDTVGVMLRRALAWQVAVPP